MEAFCYVCDGKSSTIMASLPTLKSGSRTPGLLGEISLVRFRTHRYAKDFWIGYTPDPALTPTVGAAIVDTVIWFAFMGRIGAGGVRLVTMILR